jgi:hypothetical protein
MITIVETDATTVRVKEYPRRNKKLFILGVFLLTALICSTVALLAYFHKRNEYNSEKSHQSDGILLKTPFDYANNSFNNEHLGNVIHYL